MWLTWEADAAQGEVSGTAHCTSHVQHKKNSESQERRHDMVDIRTVVFELN